MAFVSYTRAPCLPADLVQGYIKLFDFLNANPDERSQVSFVILGNDVRIIEHA